MVESESPGRLVWELAEPAGRGGRPALSRAAIAAAAARVADAEGPGAVTMRRVATELGSSTPMSLYRYVGSKDGLIDLMIDEVAGEVVLPAGHTDWRADLRAFAVAQRDAVARHPWFGEFLFSRPHLGPNALRNVDFALATLDGHDLPVGTAMALVSMVQGYAISSATAGAAESRMRESVGLRTDEELRASVQGFLDGV